MTSRFHVTAVLLTHSGGEVVTLLNLSFQVHKLHRVVGGGGLASRADREKSLPGTRTAYRIDSGSDRHNYVMRGSDGGGVDAAVSCASPSCRSFSRRRRRRRCPG